MKPAFRTFPARHVKAAHNQQFRRIHPAAYPPLVIPVQSQADERLDARLRR